MKTGKYFPLGYHKNIKIGYGTVDYKNIKSIYIDFNTWILPKNEDDFEKIISKTRKKIKKFFLENKTVFFQRECIVNLDISTKGLKLNKRSFMSLELTLYVNNIQDIKSQEIKDEIVKISKTVIDDYLNDKNLFNFHKNKKIKI